MSGLQWAELALFMAALLAVAMLALTASGHFPAQHRAPRLRTVTGAAILWGTLGLGLATLVLALVFAVRRLPIPAAVIGGGLAVLAAPLLLQPLPDIFVDGRRGLVAFAAAGVAIALVLLLRLA